MPRRAASRRQEGPGNRRSLRATKMGKAAELVEQAVHETLTYYGFPDIHWQKIRTNNPLERIMREIRRRTRVVGAFPDGQSCLNLAAARLRHIAGTKWSAKCYMNMRPLYQQHNRNRSRRMMNVRKILDTTWSSRHEGTVGRRLGVWIEAADAIGFR